MIETTKYLLTKFFAIVPTGLSLCCDQQSQNANITSYSHRIGIRIADEVKEWESYSKYVPFLPFGYKV